MRQMPISRYFPMVLSVAFVLIGMPAHATTPPPTVINEHAGLYCLLEPGVSPGYTANIVPNGLTLTPTVANTSATFFCPATFSTTISNAWITNIGFSVDARRPSTNASVPTTCQEVLISNNGSFTINNVSGTDTNSYYGIESAYFSCTISNVEARINGYKVMLGYYAAPPPP